MQKPEQVSTKYDLFKQFIFEAQPSNMEDKSLAQIESIKETLAYKA